MIDIPTQQNNSYIAGKGTAMAETYRIILIVCTMVALGLGVAVLVISVLLKAQIPQVTMETKAVLDLLTYMGSSIAEYAQRMSILSIVAPSLCITSSVFAFIAIGLYKPVPLFVMSGFVFITVVIQITATSLWYTYSKTINKEFSDDGTFKIALISNLNDSYKEDSITAVDDDFSKAWNYLFLERHCCGVNPVHVGGRGDFQRSYWVRSGAAASQKIPTSCCVNVTSASYNAPTACKDNVNKGTYYDTGCLANLENWFDFIKHSTVYLGLSIAIDVVQTVVGVFGILYALKLRTDGYDAKSTKGFFHQIKQQFL